MGLNILTRKNLSNKERRKSQLMPAKLHYIRSVYTTPWVFKEVIKTLHDIFIDGDNYPLGRSLPVASLA
jgi:hypothetical protein